MSRAIKVKDLKNQIGISGNVVVNNPFLYCRKCGAEYSANAGDYFMAPSDHVFKCCNVNMLLVKKHTQYEEV